MVLYLAEMTLCFAVVAEKAALEDDNVTFLMNGQSLEALAFRIVSF